MPDPSNPQILHPVLGGRVALKHGDDKLWQFPTEVKNFRQWKRGSSVKVEKIKRGSLSVYGDFGFHQESVWPWTDLLFPFPVGK